MNKNKKFLNTRGVALVELCIKELSQAKNSKKAKPLNKKILSKIVLEKGKPLPPTLLKFLAYDMTFQTLVNIRAESRSKNMVWQETNPFGKNPNLPKIKPASNTKLHIDQTIKGKLFPLPFAGEQEHFLYVGKADTRGEYPIVGVETEDDTVYVWIKYSAFDLYLADQISYFTTPNSFPLFEEKEFKAEFKTLQKLNPELEL